MRLLTKEVPFSLDKEQYLAFIALCDAFASSPVLVHPNHDKPFAMFTDASNFYVGAILAQLANNKASHHIAYYSNNFSKAERNYSFA